jgi:hypothetical protein
MLDQKIAKPKKVYSLKGRTNKCAENEPGTRRN